MHHTELIAALRGRAGAGDAGDAGGPGDGARDAQHARLVLRLVHEPSRLPRHGLTAKRFASLLDQRCPLAFDDAGAFELCVDELRAALRDALGEGGEPGQLRVIGTAATLFSLNPDKCADHFFDAGGQGRSDLDLGLESPAVFAWLVARGAFVEPSRINPAGTVARGELCRCLPPVGAWLDRWSTRLGRDTALVVAGEGRPRASPSVMDMLRPLGR